MTKDFEWTTEDEASEGVWEPDVNVPVVRRKWGRWHWGVLGAIIFVAVATFVAYSQLERQAAAVSNLFRDDVLGVHQLVVETAVSRDTDLFQTFLSNPASSWATNQTELIARDLYFNRAPLGLWLDSSQQMTNTVTISNTKTSFSPDFQQVTVQVEQPYLARNANGEMAQVRLVNTAVYRQQNSSWQLAAPDDAFWGETQQLELETLTVHYPTRDTKIAERLANDLDQLIRKACDQNLFPCVQNLAVDLHFEPEVQTLLGLNRNFELASRYSPNFGRRYSLTLPTPTLVGLPADDVGFDALYRGYAAQVLAALITNLHPNFFAEFPDRNLLSTQLAQLEFTMPDPVGYHPLETAVPPPIPFPEQDILAFCRESASPLNLYNFQSGSWLNFGENNSNLDVKGLENDDGVLLTGLFDTGDYVVWWRPGGERILTTGQLPPMFLNDAFLYPNDAKTQHVINYSVGAMAQTFWSLLDESTCDDQQCELTDIDDYPIASENGRFQLNIRLSEFNWTHQIELEDTTTGSLTDYGLGFNPLWIDEETFAFIRPNEDAGYAFPSQSTLVIVDAAQPQNDVREITMNDISDSLNGLLVPDDLLIGGLLQKEDTQWVLLVFERSGSRISLAYLLEFEPETGWAFPFQGFREFETAVFLGTSPNNRYFSIGLLEQSNVVMRLYDAQQNDYTSYSVRSAWRGGFDWTLDGNWLLILEDEGFRLVAPDHDYEHFIGHDFGRCETAVWVNP